VLALVGGVDGAEPAVSAGAVSAAVRSSFQAVPYMKGSAIAGCKLVDYGRPVAATLVPCQTAPMSEPSPINGRSLPVVALVAVAWALVAFWRASNLTGDLMVDLFIVPGGGLAVALLVLLSTAAGLRGLLRGPAPRPGWRTSLGSPLMGAFVLLAMFALLVFDLPFRARFVVSRPALARFAQQMSPGQDLRGERRVGLFGVEEVSRSGAATEFTLGLCGFSTCGLVYSPNELPPRYGRRQVKALGGPWWSVSYGSD
jgi:hypothetical protein